MSSYFTGIIRNCSRRRCAETSSLFFIFYLFLFFSFFAPLPLPLLWMFFFVMSCLLRLTATTTARWRAAPARTSVSAPAPEWSESFFPFFFNRAGSQLINISGGGGGGGCRGALNKNLGVISGRGSGAQLTFPAKWADLLPSLADCSAGSLSPSIFCFPWETLCNPTPPTSPRARERERDASCPLPAPVFPEDFTATLIDFGPSTFVYWQPTNRRKVESAVQSNQVNKFGRLYPVKSHKRSPVFLNCRGC